MYFNDKVRKYNFFCEYKMFVGFVNEFHIFLYSD